jgi:hypothetical protein
MTYNQYRSYSDKSLPEAKKHIANFIGADYLHESTFYDDTTNALDLYFEAPKIKVSHRSRKKEGDIKDITIKTKSKFDIPCEYDKLIQLAESNKDPWYYFYCYYNETKNKIIRYIIYDLGKLIQSKEFQDKSIFEYSADKINREDGGSHFNCITVQKLINMDLVRVNWSKIT